MPNPIEWKEADRVETTRVPGASARLVVRRTRAPGSHPDGTPRAVCRVDDATPADLASALGALPAGERAQVLQAFGSDPEMRAALLADCAVAWGRAAVAEAERDDTREELRALEWLASKGCASRPVFVGRDGPPFVYATYAGAARALGWEG